jgi:hypothetical protein
MTYRRLRLLALGAFTFSLVLLAGCGGKDSIDNEFARVKDTDDTSPAPKQGGDVKKTEKKTDGAKPAPGGKKTAVPHGAGSLKGRVTFTGDLAKLMAYQDKESQALVSVMRTKPAELPVCHDAAPAPEKQQQEWIVSEGGGVANVFVYLKPADGTVFEVTADHPGVQALKDKDVILDQPHCAFIPHALAILPKFRDTKTRKEEAVQKLIVKNTAKTDHNTKFGDKVGLQPGGNLTVPKGSQLVVTNIVPSDDEVLFQCSVHPWMSAVGRAFNHPYFAITDKDGNFEIKNVPAGDVQVVVWHEKAGFLNAGGTNKGEKVTLSDKTTTKDFTTKGP